MSNIASEDSYIDSNMCKATMKFETSIDRPNKFGTGNAQFLSEQRERQSKHITGNEPIENMTANNTHFFYEKIAGILFSFVRICGFFFFW